MASFVEYYENLKSNYIATSDKTDYLKEFDPSDTTTLAHWSKLGKPNFDVVLYAVWNFLYNEDYQSKIFIAKDVFEQYIRPFMQEQSIIVTQEAKRFGSKSIVYLNQAECEITFCFDSKIKEFYNLYHYELIIFYDFDRLHEKEIDPIINALMPHMAGLHNSQVIFAGPQRKHKVQIWNLFEQSCKIKKIVCGTIPMKKDEPQVLEAMAKVEEPPKQPFLYNHNPPIPVPTAFQVPKKQPTRKPDPPSPVSLRNLIT